MTTSESFRKHILLPSLLFIVCEIIKVAGKVLVCEDYMQGQNVPSV